MNNIEKIFVQEATDLINDLEKSVLLLENNTDDQKLIEEIFRIMHTLKGNSTMFGFDKIGDFLHHLETLYDLVRSGAIMLSKEILNLTLASVDHLKILLTDANISDEATLSEYEEILQQVKRIIQDNDTALSKDSPPGLFSTASEKEVIVKTYYILFKPNKNILVNGTNPLYLLDELHTIGKCKVVAHTENIPLITDIEHTKCYTYWEIYLATGEGADAIKDVFIFVEDESDLVIEKLSDEDLMTDSTFIEAIEEKKLSYNELKKIAKKLETGLVKTAVKKMPEKTTNDTGSISSIRVASDKLDELMNLVSELVTTQASLSLYAEKNPDPDIESISENVEKLSRQLRDIAFGMTLIPINNMFGRFQRMIRDLSNELGKDVSFLTEGGETELDRKIIEGLTDPLMHILRNSLDHGIENAEARMKKGKPKQGTILLKAFYSGANVNISIKDDGKGIDPEFIRNKAIEKGLIEENDILSEKEIFTLLFLPGFSTVEKVTDVSGRGVGMDVAKRNISALKGEIIVASEIDKGTTITIILPLTLSIIDGLLVELSNINYVIPLSVVDKCYEVSHREMEDNFNNQLLLDGEKVPFINLRNEFNISEKSPETEQIIVVNNEEKKVGLNVDSIIGEYQAVLKPVGKYYDKQDFVSGATILGDGTIALVLDTNKIINQYSEKK